MAFPTNLVLGQFNPGYTAQPIAHSNLLWNILGMVLAGLAYALQAAAQGGNCSRLVREMVDPGVFVLGMITGVAFAHNFNLAAKTDAVVDGVLKVGGLSTAGMVAVILWNFGLYCHWVYHAGKTA